MGLLIPEIQFYDSVYVMRHTNKILNEMKHSNGLVSLRNFKNFLITHNFYSVKDLTRLKDKVKKIIKIWRDVRL